MKDSLKKIVADGEYKTDWFSKMETAMKETNDLLGEIITNILTDLYERINGVRPCENKLPK